MKKLPRVVIVGFPNVGKSSLFNRLLGEKKALVHSLPGMTRDCFSSVCTLYEKKFVLMDTGGFFGSEEEPLSWKVREKAWETSQEADLLLFVLDGKRDLLPAEEELFYSLRKLNKPIYVIVNKVDSPSQETKIGEFYRLGTERIFAISAEHNRNLDELIESLVEVLPISLPAKEEQMPLRIAIVGRINVGKSSIVNRLCGEERLLVSEKPGTTRDSTDTLITRDKQLFCLVDTAGIRKLGHTEDKREQAGIINAKKNIARSDVICLVLDAQEFPTRQDAAIAHLAHESGKPLILALNKWDLIQKAGEHSKSLRESVYRKLDFVNYAPLLFISAKTGKRVVKILDDALEVYKNASKRTGTSQLNNFLAGMNKTHPPLSKNKRKLKVKYMTQIGILPPTFILFAHARASLFPAYERYFIQLLREKFDYWGTPIRLFVRNSRGEFRRK